MTITDKPNTTGGQGGRSSQEHGAGVGIMAEQIIQNAAGKTIPAGYKQTEVGVIPEDWDVAMLRDISAKITDGTHDTPKPVIEGIPFLTAIHVKDGMIDFDGCYFLPESIHNEIYCRCNPEFGDILMVNIGSGTATTAVVNVDYEFSLKNVALIKPNKGNNGFYINYALGFSKKKIIDTIMTGGAQPFLSLTQIALLQVPVPSLEEQTAIANVLSDSDALIDALEQLIAKKQAIKSATMQQLLTGRTRLPAFSLRPDGTPKGYKPSELGEIPEDWNVVEMAKIGSFGRGRVISHTEINKSYSKLYPVYSSQTSNDGVMGYLDSFNFDGEFVTWTTDGVNAGKVFYRNGKFNCTNVCGVIKIKDACARYVAIAMDQEARKYVSTNLANPKLMNGVAKQVLIRFPNDIEEQTAIATILSDMDNELQALTQKLEKARALKQGMMQQLLTGKIRLPLAVGA